MTPTSKGQTDPISVFETPDTKTNPILRKRASNQHQLEGVGSGKISLLKFKP